jgi:hypothetical protein
MWIVGVGSSWSPSEEVAYLNRLQPQVRDRLLEVRNPGERFEAAHAVERAVIDGRPLSAGCDLTALLTDRRLLLIEVSGRSEVESDVTIRWIRLSDVEKLRNVHRRHQDRTVMLTLGDGRKWKIKWPPTHVPQPPEDKRFACRFGAAALGLKTIWDL